MLKLLTRDQFREQTLARANGICCIPECSAVAVDAHHILNRNLFTEPTEAGGYFLENGAQLCSKHHYDAELTKISVEDLRKYCSITEPAIPTNLLETLSYDCWGNEILADGMRRPGPLFEDSGCQNALRAGSMLWKFSAF